MITLQHRRARNVCNLKVCDFICKMLLKNVASVNNAFKSLRIHVYL